MVHWYTTTEGERWQTRTVEKTSGKEQVNVRTSGVRGQPFWGLGGCFNELGWAALEALSDARRREVVSDLFGDEGCGFTLGRIPIGASDYALDWYSADEVLGDYGLEHFSIDRDRRALIPYIRTAMGVRSEILFFASPWSPPTWMKDPPVYNYGRLRSDPDVQSAYARYLAKFVEAYGREGIVIAQVHVQNEPLADQKFPSCIWEGTQMRTFIQKYLGPVFKAQIPKTAIWLGTINGDDYDGWASTVLSDPAARAVVAGVGYQWGGKGAIQRTFQSYPDVPLMQTENECGDGANTWDYATYVFSLAHHYITNGARAYVYWNMVLAPGGRSTWGWKQNAMVTVDPANGEVTYNPEYFVMKHLGHAVRSGAVREVVEGSWAGHTLAFLNADGSRCLALSNPLSEARTLSLDIGGTKFAARLEPRSFHTFVVGP
jgi:glucosylceramidase